MRFSTLSSTLLILVLVAFAFVNAESYYNIDTNNLIRRAEEETHGHGGGSASSSAVMAESTEATSSSHGKGGSATTSAAAEATSSAKTGHGGGGGNNKAAQYGNFASPSILQGGSLFYIGISVTSLLWVTGKVIDVKTERQERYAERIAHQM